MANVREFKERYQLRIRRYHRSSIHLGICQYRQGYQKK